MLKKSLIILVIIFFGYTSAKQIQCGSVTSSKNFHLVNPTLPPNFCNYKIQAYSKYVCQLRIDFDMILAQPTVPSLQNNVKFPKCINDYFQIGDYKFCGIERNQHIYIPFSRDDGTITLKIFTTHRAGGSKLPPISWNFNVQQLECPKGSPSFVLPNHGRSYFSDGNLIAPLGCLQYYPDRTGIVKSFNYNNGMGPYLGDLHYSICFRREVDTKEIQFDFKAFQLGYKIDYSKAMNVSCRAQSRKIIENEDHLSIPYAVVEDNEINGQLFCGVSLEGKTVTSLTTGPIILQFHSDKIFNSTIPERGFLFSYVMS